MLIGYSFDDSDIRTLWQIIRSRLGKLSTPAYVVLVDASPIEVSRFERRGIKVINIRGNKANYPEILAEFFNEIKYLINDKIPEQIVYTSEKATEELKISGKNNNLCFISAPFQRISFLKELLYPVLKANGIAPVSLDEAIMPGELLTRKIDTMINQASIAVVDLSGNNANVMWELGNAMSKNKKIILIVDKEQSGQLPFNLMGIYYLTYSFSGDNSSFIESLDRYLKGLYEEKSETNDSGTPRRLLETKEYTAAVILAFRQLESTLSIKYSDTSKPSSPFGILNILNSNSDKNKKLLLKVKEYRQVRNNVVHANATVNKKEATDIVNSIEELCKVIDNGEVIVL